MTWRDHARPIIARVLAETEGQSETERRKALAKAYPYGTRRYHPYRIWCDEIALQTGHKTVWPRRGGRAQPKPDPRQCDLFAGNPLSESAAGPLKSETFSE